jgi:hypothetical protein
MVHDAKAAHEVGSDLVGLKSPFGSMASRDSIMFVFRVQQELGVPAKLIGIGEAPTIGRRPAAG